MQPSLLYGIHFKTMALSNVLTYINLDKIERIEIHGREVTVYYHHPEKEETFAKERFVYDSEADAYAAAKGMVEMAISGKKWIKMYGNTDL